jgi:aldose 1-epimerase
VNSELLQLRRGELVLDIAPALGGAIANFYSVRGGERFDWLRPAVGNATACFPLVPFCNRIRDGRFTWEGRKIVLPANDPPSPHALHGMGWQQPWEILDLDQHAVRLAWEHESGAWPWRFRAVQTISLLEDGLALRLEVSNLDSEAMPLGLGFHPFFPHRDSATITLSTSALWQADASLLPTELATPPLIAELQEGAATRDLLLDNNFIGWDRSARIDFATASGARSVSISATAPCDFAVIYAPPAADYFCIEAVSNCTDWPNLRHLPHGHIGGDILAPGATLGASMRLDTRWAG